MLIKTSAPGKLILFGEHAVVFGQSAIATTIDMRTYVTIDTEKFNDKVRLFLKNYDFILDWPLSTFTNIRLLDESYSLLSQNVVNTLLNGYNRLDPVLLNSIRSFLFLYLTIGSHYRKAKYPPIDVTVVSRLLIGVGNGSSASYSVALTGALFKLYNADLDLDLINKWAFQSEKIFHGNPSGIDNTICTYGGTLLFRNNEIQNLTHKIHLNRIVLVNTRVQRNTQELINEAFRRKNLLPDACKHIMNAIGALSTSAADLLCTDDKMFNLKTLVEMNQHLLNSLGVGHSSINKVVKIARDYDSAAKLTGGGGGGSVLIFLHPFISNEDMSDMEKEIRVKGYDLYHVSISHKGLSFD